MENELVAVEEDPRATAPQTAAQIRAQVNLIQEVMAAVMKKDTHYGIIPGVSKPSLWKPGAEKLLATFRISAQIKCVEDLSTPTAIRYRVTVQGVSPSGAVLGEGIGEASSDQTKYAWREMICQQEYDETPPDQRRAIWKKGTHPYKVMQIRTNPADQANTILKMAHKSGLIAMCLVVTGASDIFTQDIEDLAHPPQDAAKPNGKPAPATPQRASAAKPATNGAAKPAPPTPTDGNGKRLISGPQSKRLYAIWKGAQLDDAAVKGFLKERYGFSSTTEITTDVYDEIVGWCQRGGVDEPPADEVPSPLDDLPPKDAAAAREPGADG